MLVSAARHPAPCNVGGTRFIPAVGLLRGFLIDGHEGVQVVLEMYAYSGRRRIHSRVGWRDKEIESDVPPSNDFIGAPYTILNEVELSEYPAIRTLIASVDPYLSLRSWGDADDPGEIQTASLLRNRGGAVLGATFRAERRQIYGTNIGVGGKPQHRRAGRGGKARTDLCHPIRRVNARPARRTVRPKVSGVLSPSFLCRYRHAPLMAVK